jgi:hypothetical protein
MGRIAAQLLDGKRWDGRFWRSDIQMPTAECPELVDCS